MAAFANGTARRAATRTRRRATGGSLPGSGTYARAVVGALATGLLGCAEPEATPATAPVATSAASGVTADRCLVRLHGKGGTGAETVTDGDVTVIAPTGNADGWGARQWLYFPEADYDTARATVAASAAPCLQIIVDGFSNGASFAAALYCHGETFEGRLVGVVVDDPVPDHAVDGCAPDPTVPVTLYWTGANAALAVPGWDCSEADWTCQGGETIGIDAYAAALGTDIVPSPHEDHQWYLDAPELSHWR